MSKRPSKRIFRIIIVLFIAVLVPAALSIVLTTAMEGAGAASLFQTPNIVVTKRDILINDVDGDGVADPGDTLLYSVAITNTAAFNANGIVLSDTVDANTTLSGTFKSTPIARNDFYEVLGNVSISVPAASGLITGLLAINADNDPDGGAVAATAVTNAATTFGGSITIASDGSFSYDPPPAFEGNDSYLYTITDDEGIPDFAFVFLNVDDMVWFVDNSAGSSADLGTFNDPFTSTTSLNGAQGAGAAEVNIGDAIFIYQGTGTYPDGVVLQDSQVLLGQGVDLLAQLSSILNVTPPAFSDLTTSPTSGDAFRPTISDAAGAGIQIGSSNTIRGLNVGNTSAMGIVDDGTTAGPVTIDTLAITGTGGGIEIDNGGTLAVSLDSLTSSSTTEEGIDLASVTGSFAVLDGTISATGVPAVQIAGTGGGVALIVTLQSVSSSAATDGIVLNNTTGSFTVTGSGTTDSSGGTIQNITQNGVELTNASNITLSNMDLLDANTSGSESNCGPVGNNSGCFGAITVNNVSNLVLDNVTIDDTDDHGIGGTGLNGLQILNSQILNTGDGNDKFGLNFRKRASQTEANLTGSVIISGTVFNDGSDDYISVENFQGTLTLSITNTHFLNNLGNFGTCGSSNCEGSAVLLIADANVNNSAPVMNVLVEDSTFTQVDQDGVFVVAERGATNADATVDVIVRDNTFTSEMLTASVANTQGDNAVLLVVDDTGQMTFDVLNNTMIHYGGNVVQLIADGDGSDMEGIVDNNDIGNSSISNSGSSIGRGIDVLADADTVNDVYTARIRISNNDIYQTRFEGISVLNTDANSTGASLDVTVVANTVGTPTDSGGLNIIDGILIRAADSTSICARIANNTSSGQGAGAGFGEDINVQALDTSTFQIDGFGGGGDAAAETFLDGLNPASTSFAFSDGMTSFTGGSCSSPSIVMAMPASQQQIAGRSWEQLLAAAQEAASQIMDVVEVTWNDLVTLAQRAQDVDVAAIADNLHEKSGRLAKQVVSGLAAKPAAASGETLAIQLRTLNGGEQVRITFEVTVDQPFPPSAQNLVCNQGIVEGSNFADVLTDDPDTGALDDPTCTFIDNAPDLVIEKDDGGVTAVPGDTIAYTLSYSNTGSLSSSGVIITETVPAHTTFNDTSSTGSWSCADGSTSGTTCAQSVGTVAAGAAGSTIFAVDVVNPVSAGVTEILNMAEIGDDGSQGTDQNPSDNTTSETTPVNAAPDMQISKDDGGVTVAPGDTINYTITFTNTGNQNATGVVFTETVPADTTFNSGASTGGWSCLPDNSAGNTCTLAVGAVTGGAGGGQVGFVVDVDDPIGANVTQIDNTAEVGDDGDNGPDPNPGDNSASDSTLVTQVDMQVDKDDGGVTITPGGTITYTITFTNAGFTNASGVVLTETVPPNTMFNAGASTGGWVCLPGNAAGSTCTLAIGAVSGGFGGGQVDFAVDVDDPIAAGVTQIDNTVEVGDDGISGADVNPGDNSDSDSTPVIAAPDMQITKDDGGVTVPPGDTINYTITFTNTGNQNATGVVFTETVPADTTFNSGSSTGGWSCLPDNSAGSTCTLAVGGVTGGAGGGQVGFVVDVDDPIGANVTQIDNTVEVGDDGANGPDPNPGDNSSSESTPVTQVDLQISKDDGGVTITPGETITYTITFTNAGFTNASGVVITETVPANTAFNSGASTGGWTCLPDNNAGSTCTLAIGAVSGGFGGGQVDFAVDVDNPIAAGVTQIDNTVEVGDDGISGADVNPGDNSDSDSTPVVAAPDMQISKDEGDVVVLPGETILYTLIMTNTGNQNATGVVVTDTVPANTTFNASSSSFGWSCSNGDPAGTICTFDVSGTIGGEFEGDDNLIVIILFAVDVDNPLPAGVVLVTNTAEIGDDGTNGPDQNPGDNVASDTTVVNEPPEISAISPVSQTVQYSDLIATVTVTATDSGPDALTLSSSTLPSDLWLSSAMCNPPAGGGQECTWTLRGQMLEGAGTFTITVTANDGTLDSDPADIVIEVVQEDASVSFDSGNPVAVEVVSDGGNSGPFDLVVDVTETIPDLPAGLNLPGDISLADVSMILRPIGPGGSVPGACSDTTTGSGYSGVKTVTCSFNGVPVNVYAVEVTVDGEYYTGFDEDVLVIYDPSLGFTTGGGWFYWPGTANGDYPGDRTNFGYNMKYNKKGKNIQGSLLLIRHQEDGSIYRVKSNALAGLALGTGSGSDGDFDWASFAGKATYRAPGEDNQGNHRFLVYVEDYGTPGSGADKFWFQLRDKQGDFVTDLTLNSPAHDNAVTIEGGNIVVPHVFKKRGPKNQ